MKLVFPAELAKFFNLQLSFHINLIPFRDVVLIFTNRTD